MRQVVFVSATPGPVRAGEIAGRRRRADHPADRARSIRRSTCARSRGRSTTCCRRSARGSAQRRARAGDDADQADGGRPDAVLPGAGRPGALPALRHRDARARRRSCAICGAASSTCWSASTCCAKGSTCRKCRWSRFSTPTRKGSCGRPGSLIQTSGRAARNVNGRVIMYADTVTDSMRAAIGETDAAAHAAGGVQRGARHHAAVDRQADRRGDVERLRARLHDAGRDRSTAPSGSTPGASSTPTSRRCRRRCAPRRPTSISRRRRRSATTSNACATPSSGCRGRRGGPDRRVLPFIERWLKKAALEVQEYVRLAGAAFRGIFTPPVLPARHRRAVRRDRRRSR